MCKLVALRHGCTLWAGWLAHWLDDCTPICSGVLCSDSEQDAVHQHGTQHIELSEVCLSTSQPEARHDRWNRAEGNRKTPSSTLWEHAHTLTQSGIQELFPVNISAPYWSNNEWQFREVQWLYLSTSRRCRVDHVKKGVWDKKVSVFVWGLDWEISLNLTEEAGLSAPLENKFKPPLRLQMTPLRV